MHTKAILSLLLCLLLAVQGLAQKGAQPNILLVTVDDMNWNSVNAFGGEVADLTPNIDALAQAGVRFERAYVTAANCSPSRVSMQTGLYPHQSGARGFFYINDEGVPSIPSLLKGAGYFTGILNKAPDTNPSPDKEKYWDVSAGFKKIDKYAADVYRNKSGTFFRKAKQAGQPFYYVVNIADPHKPFFNDERAQKQGLDVNEPSRIVDADEVVVPGFLPDVPGVRAELRNYYNSVRRADDCVGAVLQALKKNGLAKNTLVIFLSDHGMPFPFAKSCVYDNGLRTPLVVHWPKHFEGGEVVSDQLVSMVDLMPTILDVAGVDMPEGAAYQGHSLVQMRGDESAQHPYVFGNFDENAAGIPRPSRGVISGRWNYAFNPWGTGDYPFKSATLEHRSFKTMRKLGNQGDEAIAARVKLLLARPIEELYDLDADPDCLNNLIEAPEYQDAVAEMRAALRQHMVETNDYMLAAFDVRADRDALIQWMETELQAAEARAQFLNWKRWKNMAGPTKENTQLYQPGQ